MELTTEYSSWLIIVSALLAGGYAWLLYARTRETSSYPVWLIRLLAALRFALVFFIGILLLNPLLKTMLTEVDEPLIIVAQDNSASIRNNADSGFYRDEYLDMLEQLKQQTGSNFKVKFLTFGDRVSSSDLVNFEEKRTDLSDLFDEIESRFGNSNIGALLLATDGNYNRGANPAYYTFSERFPIYTIGLGDTTHKSDIAILETRANDITYLGNQFPVEVTFSANGVKGEHVELVLWNSGKKLGAKKFEVAQNNQSFTHTFLADAKANGTQQYTVTVTTLEKEQNKRNNRQDVFVEVLDNRDRILLLAAAPHPDIAAIAALLNIKDNYEVDVVMAVDFTGDMSKYNLVIAHYLPSRRHPEIFQKIWQSNLPLLVFVGGQADIKELNNVNPGFVISENGRRTNHVSPVLNQGYSSFSLSEETVNFLADLPPLSAPFGDVEGVSSDNTVLFQALFGNQLNGNPLQFYIESPSRKTGWILGDGIWQWRMTDYRKYNTFDHFDEWLGKTIQYLSLHEDKTRFRVKVNRQIDENEPVVFSAEYYDRSYELNNSYEVKLVVSNEQEAKFDYLFSTRGDRYRLDAGTYSPGSYTYVATMNDGRESFTRKGVFVVKPMLLEWAENRADFGLLQALADRTGGEFIPVGQMDRLPDKLENNEFPSVSYSREHLFDLINLKWIFILLVLLASVEWFLRKRFVGY